MLAQGGVPADMRAWAWFETSGASALKASLPPAYFSDLVSASEMECPCQRQIELVSVKAQRDGYNGDNVQRPSDIAFG